MDAFQLADYKASKDYARLAELATSQSIICIVDHMGRREVARTQYVHQAHRNTWMVCSTGIGHITAFNRDEFFAFCKHANLMFIEPVILPSIGD